MRGPPSFSPHASSPASARGEGRGDSEAGLGLPVMGDVWEATQRTYADKSHTEGIKGLRMLKTSVKRELDFLEKVRHTVFLFSLSLNLCL